MQNKLPNLENCCASLNDTGNPEVYFDTAIDLKMACRTQFMEMP